MKEVKVLVVLVALGTMLWGLAVFSLCRRECQWVGFDQGLLMAVSLSLLTLRLWLNLIMAVKDALNGKASDRRAEKEREPVRLNVNGRER